MERGASLIQPRLCHTVNVLDPEKYCQVMWGK